MISGPIIEFLAIVSAALAIGAAIDSLALDEQKKTVSGYVFATARRPFGEFELAVIRAILRLFFNGRKFRFINILGYCAVCSVFFLYLVKLAVDVTFDISSSFGSISIEFILQFISMILSSFIFYTFSLFLTRFLYIDRSPRWPFTIPTLLIDSMISSVLPFFVGNQMQDADEFFFSELVNEFFIEEILSEYFAFGTMISGFVAVTHNIIFGLIILFGAIARLIAYAAKLNIRLANNSQVREKPFTYIAFLTGVALYGLQLVGW